ncbi:hypothetical protein K1719_044272 [Acacia pycnantha]|nr:hypothetical protein K1719_044272 [Acacia pycnantha]
MAKHRGLVDLFLRRRNGADVAHSCLLLFFSGYEGFDVVTLNSKLQPKHLPSMSDYSTILVLLLHCYSNFNFKIKVFLAVTIAIVLMRMRRMKSEMLLSNQNLLLSQRYFL